VPGDGGLGKARDGRILNGGNCFADQITGLSPTGAEHQSHVVTRGARSLRDHGGGVGGNLERVDGGVAQIQGFDPRVVHAGSLAAQAQRHLSQCSHDG